MPVWMVTVSTGGNPMRKFEVLVAVEPVSLLRIIEHLFCGPEFVIVESISEWPLLARKAARLRPELIIANMSLLGQGAAKIISDIKQASPVSKLILVSFPHPLEPCARKWGADAYLEEEDLVRQLLPTAKKLLVQMQQGARRGPRKSREVSSLPDPTLSSGKTSRISSKKQHSLNPPLIAMS